MSQNLHPQKKDTKPLLIALPVLVGGGIALVVLCAAAFAVYAIFFYEPGPDQEKTEPTPTYEIVRFQNEGEPLATTEPAATPLVSASESDTPVPTEVANPEQSSPPADPNAGQQTEPQPPPVEVRINTSPVTMTSPDYGMQVFLFWQEEIADRDLQLVQDAGFRWVKQEFAWRELEGAGKGAFDWSRSDRIMDQIDAHGLNVIVRLGVQPEWAGGGYPEVGPPNNLQDFADFATAVATRYKGRVDAYQIWNEPNLAREWGNRPPNAAEYTQMLKAAYEAIKAIDPYPLIISAGMAPTTRNDDVARPDTYFVQEMYDAGAKPYFDALGVHGAGYASPPETDPAEVARTPGLANPGDFKPENAVPEELRRVYCFRHVEDVRAVMVANGDADKQVVLLEFGWTIDPRPDSPYNWHAVTPEQQDQYFQRAYAYAKENWRPWIGVMSLIYIANPQWTMQDEQTYWSIVYPTYPEFTPAPAYFGLKGMPKD
ncbi:MAG: cellulase family glycosylhydrolase [Anaerolineae bacterium]|nr:cellulase family glycosylhydrolase [Anaerolineae bacterium]